MALFSGNEIIAGIILSAWLALFSLGMLIQKTKLLCNIKAEPVLLLQVILFPVIPLLLKMIYRLFVLVPFEILPLHYVSIIVVLVLFLPCVLLGFVFSIVNRAFFVKQVEQAGNMAGVPAGKIYALETLGALVGGLFCAFCYLINKGPLQITVVMSVLIAVYLIVASKNKLYKRLGFVFMVFYSGLMFTGSIAKIDNYSSSYLYKPFELVQSRNSIYGTVSVLKSKEDYSFYVNGSKIFTTSAQKEYCEQLVHLCMLQSGKTGHILLIGGGISGNLQEVLKYDIKEADYVELDPVLIELGRQYGGNTDVLNDKRVNIINQDARLYIKNTTKKYDYIIVDMPDPVNQSLNRFYTAEFFNELKNIAGRDTVIITGISASENYMPGNLRSLTSSVYYTIQKEFKYFVVLPGIKNYFVFSDSKVTDNPNYLIKQLKTKKINTVYLTPYYLSYLLDRYKIERLNAQINPENVQINEDFKPVAGYYALLFWLSQYNEGFKMPALKTDNVLVPVICFAMVFFVLMLLIRKRIRYVMWLMLFMAGFVSMFIELTLLAGFQSVFGYMIGKISLLIALVMAGLSAGSYAGLVFIKRNKSVKYIVVLVFIILFVYLLFFPLFLKMNLNQPCWYLLIFVPNVFIGTVFTLINSITAGIDNDGAKTFGDLYIADLAGAVSGSLLTSLVLLPILGITNGCYLVLAFLFFVILLLIIV
ncbi:MAG: hypothetical protein A2252_10505 [Elusimicrobia bacterium RIFOXYA2_FULL_39_19]|nr:MAG: hypothetical protein A2252_10505 [Elusimicrobia bacterium RIFOXYA2_FULL_39_19]